MRWRQHWTRGADVPAPLSLICGCASFAPRTAIVNCRHQVGISGAGVFPTRCEVKSYVGCNGTQVLSAEALPDYAVFTARCCAWIQ